MVPLPMPIFFALSFSFFPDRSLASVKKGEKTHVRLNLILDFEIVKIQTPHKTKRKSLRSPRQMIKVVNIW